MTAREGLVLSCLVQGYLIYKRNLPVGFMPILLEDWLEAARIDYSVEATKELEMMHKRLGTDVALEEQNKNGFITLT